ncbi:NF-kappa-B-repressing factor [Biomphalaria pfeifferi]|uniref:NF-kappa-B-repressing factor n=1 Tax=Biomphalaria pfeifferi TaxID=112525 RepID=A0AAD8C3H9_BIOPF|nr:NF-kappa-B-repressing factor [Biomphalaria pfeifferi]
MVNDNAVAHNSGSRKCKGKAYSSKEIQFVKTAESLSPDNQKLETRDSTENKMTVLERVDNPRGSGSWEEPLLLSSQDLSDHVGDTAAASVPAKDIEQLMWVSRPAKLPKYQMHNHSFPRRNTLLLGKQKKMLISLNFESWPMKLWLWKTCAMIASGEGFGARCHAYEAALQKIFMPYLRLVNLDDPSRAELHASVTPFTPVSQRVDTLSPTLNSEKVETNTAKKRREDSTNNEDDNLNYFREFKPIEDFVIVEPLMPDTENRPTCTLGRSASFNQMIVEYDYLSCDDGDFRCILKIEGKVLADMKGVTKPDAKNEAAAEWLKRLRQMCWTIKIKKGDRLRYYSYQRGNVEPYQ